MLILTAKREPEIQGEGDRSRERGREGKANKTHVRCRQRVYHLQPVKFIFVQPRLVMRYGSPYSAADSTPNPTPSQSPLTTHCQVSCERVLASRRLRLQIDWKHFVRCQTKIYFIYLPLTMANPFLPSHMARLFLACDWVNKHP